MQTIKKVCLGYSVGGSSVDREGCLNAALDGMTAKGKGGDLILRMCGAYSDGEERKRWCFLDAINQLGSDSLKEVTNECRNWHYNTAASCFEDKIMMHIIKSAEWGDESR